MHSLLQPECYACVAGDATQNNASKMVWLELSQQPSSMILCKITARFCKKEGSNLMPQHPSPQDPREVSCNMQSAACRLRLLYVTYLSFGFAVMRGDLRLLLIISAAATAASAGLGLLPWGLSFRTPHSAVGLSTYTSS